MVSGPTIPIGEKALKCSYSTSMPGWASGRVQSSASSRVGWGGPASCHVGVSPAPRLLPAREPRRKSTSFVLDTCSSTSMTSAVHWSPNALMAEHVARLAGGHIALQDVQVLPQRMVFVIRTKSTNPRVFAATFGSSATSSTGVPPAMAAPAASASASCPCVGQNRLAPMLISSARTVVLNRYARMQCSDPTRRIGLDTNDTSAVWPDVPMTAAK